MTSTFWTLSEAAAWIVSRSSRAVEEAPSSLVELLLIDSSEEIRRAIPDLWAALSSGRLVATGIGSDGIADRRREIPSELWQDLQPFIDPRLGGSIERFHRPGLHTGEAFAEVTVVAEAVVKAWPATAEDPAPARRGPPPKVDHAKFEREAHAYIAENGMPDPALDPRDRQADLERHMMRWHGDKIGTTQNRTLVRKAMKSYVVSNSGR